MRHKLLIPLTVAAAAGAVVLFSGVLRESSSAGASALPAERVAATFEPSYSSAQDAATLVLRLQEHLRDHPTDGDSYALLGLAYQQRARETGDPAYYPKSEAVLDRARTLNSHDPIALSGLASLALTRHQFSLALALAQQARTLAPSTARNFGAIGDALLELGRYDAAFAAFDTMARLKPNVAAYARVSYARELRGDMAGARAAMELASESTVPGSEAAAWSQTQLGKLLFSVGRLRCGREGIPDRPRAPAWVCRRSRCARARRRCGGRSQPRCPARASRRDDRALPQYVGALGDFLGRQGKARAARRQYALVAAIDRLQRASGMRTDVEYALFETDHGIDLPDALRRARIGQQARPSIDGDDALAWALERNGGCTEALGYSKLALRLGTKDATKLFHRGMIERCLGHAAEARTWFRKAVRLNPGFSPLWSPVAQRHAR